MFFWWNPVYFLFALPGIVLALWAQWRVNSTYGKYAQVRNSRNMTGEEVAGYLLRQNGLAGTVGIAGTPGTLLDHYDPRDRTLYLSQEVARKPSVAALGIVAHEVGHAVQHAQSYPPLAFRMAIVPVVNLGSRFGFIVFFIGFILAAWIGAAGAFSETLVWLGIFLMSGAVLFSLVTLPVEYNASGRALSMLQQSGLVQGQELGEAKQVLSAAGLTYVAAAAGAALNLLYYIFLAMGLSGRRR